MFYLIIIYGMTDSKAIVNIMCDVSFSNLEMYEPPESGRWYVVISGEKIVVFLSLCEYE